MHMQTGAIGQIPAIADEKLFKSAMFQYTVVLHRGLSIQLKMNFPKREFRT